MKIGIGFLLVTLQLVAQTAFAIEDSKKPKVYFTCLLRYTNNASCANLIQDFYSRFSSVVIQVGSESEAQVVVNLTDQQVDAQVVQYTYEVKFRAADGSLVVPMLPSFFMNSSLDAVSASNILLGNAIQGPSLYLFTQGVTISNGKLVTTRQLNTQEERTSWLKKGPLAATANLTVNYNNRGTGQYNNNGYDGQFLGTVDYITPKFKESFFSVVGKGHSSTFGANGGRYTANSSYHHLSLLSIYSFSKHWDVAVFVEQGADTNQNIKDVKHVGAGVEWLLIPVRTTQNKELAVRVGGLYSDLNLRDQNIHGLTKEQFFNAFLRLYLYWVFKDKITLSGQASVRENLKYKGFTHFGLDATFAYNITTALQLTAKGNFTYSKASLTFPADPDASNPILNQQLSGQVGPSVTLKFGVAYSVGNISKKNSDRRWNSQ